MATILLPARCRWVTRILLFDARRNFVFDYRAHPAFTHSRARRSRRRATSHFSPDGARRARDGILALRHPEEFS